MIGMPAVVVGHQCHCRVADLGFARELGFLQVGHADDVRAPRPVQIRLRKGGKLRAFHADVGAAAMHAGGCGFCRRRREASERLTHRMREAYVRDDAVAEEGGDAIERAIDELIGEHQIERAQLFTQAAHRAGRDDGFDPEHLEAKNVRPVIQLRGHQPVALAVPGQKRHAFTAQRRQGVRPRRLTERRRQRLPTPIAQLRHVIQPAPANNANLRFHRLPFRFRGLSDFRLPRPPVARPPAPGLDDPLDCSLSVPLPDAAGRQSTGRVRRRPDTRVR